MAFFRRAMAVRTFRGMRFRAATGKGAFCGGEDSTADRAAGHQAGGEQGTAS